MVLFPILFQLLRSLFLKLLLYTLRQLHIYWSHNKACIVFTLLNLANFSGLVLNSYISSLDVGKEGIILFIEYKTESYCLINFFVILKYGLTYF